MVVICLGVAAEQDFKCLVAQHEASWILVTDRLLLRVHLKESGASGPWFGTPADIVTPKGVYVQMCADDLSHDGWCDGAVHGGS